MASWLSRATSLFKQSPPPLETYQVECDCGAKLTGQRSASYQKPACPACSLPVFVLPANVYPRPKSANKPKAKQDAKPQAPPVPNTKALVKDIPALVPPTPVPKVAKPVEERVSRQDVLSELTYRRYFHRPKITRLRAVTSAIVLMSLLTIYGLIHRHRVETAKAIVSKAADAGAVALRDRDFETAAFEFDRARQAVDVLGRTDSAALEIRQQSAETTAIAKLSSSTLTEIIEETLAKKAAPLQSLPLSSSIKDSWAVFDVRFHPESKGQKVYRIDAPMIVDKVGVEIEIASDLFKGLPWTDESGEPSRVIFGAQFERMSQPSGDPQTSVLTLNGKTAFLWANYENFVSIGYRPPDEENEKETRALLKRQIEVQQSRK